MALKNLSLVKAAGGGAGVHGKGTPRAVSDAVEQLQNMKVSLVAGATASTKIDIAAMRDHDVILSILHFTTAAAMADLTGNATISTLYATGTITISGLPVADETVTINGVVFTFKGTATAPYTEVLIGADATGTADNLVAAIDAYNASPGVTKIPASFVNAAGTITVTADVQGAVGNAITLVESATNVAVSGATLSGGTDTGGFSTDTDTSTDQLIVYWYDLPEDTL